VWCGIYFVLVLYDIVAIIVFQSIFGLKIYLNNIFLFFKIYFLYQHIKKTQKHKKIILNKKIQDI
jgi:hypothetical protein